MQMLTGIRGNAQAAHLRGVASSETAREINRDILLHTIHLHQPVSRADLARLTGLQPSTVSVITGQLIEEGWVLPGTLGRLPRGRRPTFVTLNDKHVTLAIDLRPENANLAVVDINGKILRRDAVAYSAQSASKGDVKKTIQSIAKAARALRAELSDRIFQGVGVSVSGRVDQKTHRLLFSPNVPWTQIDLHSELQKLLESPIEMENAANACLFAERWFGNFSETQNMIAVSVSEGIGTGLMVAWCAAETTWPANSATCRSKSPGRFAIAAMWDAGRPSHPTAPGCAITRNWCRRAISRHSRNCSAWPRKVTCGPCVRSTR